MADMYLPLNEADLTIEPNLTDLFVRVPLPADTFWPAPRPPISGVHLTQDALGNIRIHGSARSSEDADYWVAELAMAGITAAIEVRT